MLTRTTLNSFSKELHACSCRWWRRLLFFTPLLLELRLRHGGMHRQPTRHGFWTSAASVARGEEVKGMSQKPDVDAAVRICYMLLRVALASTICICSRSVEACHWQKGPPHGCHGSPPQGVFLDIRSVEACGLWSLTKGTTRGVSGKPRRHNRQQLATCHNRQWLLATGQRRLG